MIGWLTFYDFREEAFGIPDESIIMFGAVWPSSLPAVSENNSHNWPFPCPLCPGGGGGGG